MDSKQEQADPPVPDKISIPGQYPNQPGNQQQGNDQMYAAPPAYPSIGQYQPEPAYTAPLQYQPGLVIVHLNF